MGLTTESNPSIHGRDALLNEFCAAVSITETLAIVLILTMIVEEKEIDIKFDVVEAKIEIILGVTRKSRQFFEEEQTVIV